MGVDLLIGKEVELFLLDRGIYNFRFRLGKQRAIFEVAEVEDHQGAYVHPFERPDDDLGHKIEIVGFDFAALTRDILIEDEPSNVRKCEEEGDHGV